MRSLRRRDDQQSFHSVTEMDTSDDEIPLPSRNPRAQPSSNRALKSVVRPSVPQRNRRSPRSPSVYRSESRSQARSPRKASSSPRRRGPGRPPTARKLADTSRPRTARKVASGGRVPRKVIGTVTVVELQ